MSALSLGFIFSAFLAVLFSVEAFHEIQVKECNAPHMSFHNPLRPDFLCQHGCKEGCYCEKNYILNRRTGKCQPGKAHYCGKNEHVGCGDAKCAVFCGSSRDYICDLAAFRCGYSCFCNPGYIKITNGPCILIEDCPLLVDPEQCGENEVYHHANKTNYCIMGCKSGCVCKPGYVMMDTKCVPQKFSDISPCKENEELKCGNYDCQTFCDLGPDPLCYLNRFDCYYEYACMCKEGYIRIDEGDCIPIDECPSKVFHLDYEED